MANRQVKNNQQTVRFHVDDILCSHIDPEVNTEFYRWSEKKYGGLKPVKVKRGKIHEFLGMTMNFEKTPGAVHIEQDGHVLDMLESFPEELSGKALTPAANDLFMTGAGGLLSESKREVFHSIVANGLFVEK